MKFATTIFVVILTLSVSAFGQSQPSAPTLRIVTEDPNLPSELFYGNIKVKPVRLRPGTNQPITYFDNDAWLQQHYIDFLGRMPDGAGFNAWLTKLSGCPAAELNNPTSALDCDRTEVSSAFFRSPEFQLKGYYVLRFYQATLGRLSTYNEYVADARAVTGQTDQELAQKRAAFPLGWVTRQEFLAKYPTSLSAEDFVARLAQTAGGVSNQTQLAADLAAGRKTRAQVVLEVVESREVFDRFYNRAFVAMTYFGYLRRDPDAEGYRAWLELLDRTGDYSHMVWGAVYSPEYQLRFGHVNY